MSRASDLARLQGYLAHWLSHRNSDGNFTINDSFNSSSQTDNANGDTTVQMSFNFANTNYCVQATAGSNSAQDRFALIFLDGALQQATNTYRVISYDVSVGGATGITLLQTGANGDLA